MELIKPQTITVTDADKTPHTFVVSRMPAVAGREVLAKYPLANMPKTGDYSVSQEAMLLMMSYVGKEMENGDVLRLKTQGLIDNHVPDGEALIRLEIEMLRYNTSFFGSAGGKNFLDSLLDKITGTLPSIIKTLIHSLQQSFPQDSQPTRNSKQPSTSKKR